MENRFFEKPILNSPDEYPVEHWELDNEGQPAQQQQLFFDRRPGASNQDHQYDPHCVITVQGIRLFFYQVEAIANAIWLSEMVPGRSRPEDSARFYFSYWIYYNWFNLLENNFR